MLMLAAGLCTTADVANSGQQENSCFTHSFTAAEN